MDAHTTSPLGNTAEIAAPNSGRDPRRARRYHLQSLAAELLPGERVSECLRALAPLTDHVEVVHDPARKTARYRNLVVCSRVWICPVCAARITEQRRSELTLAAASSDFVPLLLTFTLRHKKNDRLDSLLSALLEAVRFFKSGAAWQRIKDQYHVAGSIRSLEVTHGEKGWHPHCHMMLLLYAPLSKPETRRLEAECKKIWLRALSRQGFDATWENGLDIRSADRDVQDYIAKFGHEPHDLGWTPEHELTKSHTKSSLHGRSPFQLLEDYGSGDRVAGKLFVEYARCFKGRNQLVWSRGLRDLLGLGAEPEAVADGVVSEFVEEVEAVNSEVLASFSRGEWKVILLNDARVAVLDVAAMGDAVKLHEFVSSLPGMGWVVRIDLGQVLDAPGQSIARVRAPVGAVPTGVG